MNRRQMFTSLLGAPLAAAAVTVASVGGELVLVPGAVQIDLHVYDTTEGRTFALRLLKQPWPIVGDRVRLDFERLHLVGVVEESVTQALYKDRCVCDVIGRVLEFRALGAMA